MRSALHLCEQLGIYLLLAIAARSREHHVMSTAAVTSMQLNIRICQTHGADARREVAETVKGFRCLRHTEYRVQAEKTCDDVTYQVMLRGGLESTTSASKRLTGFVTLLTTVFEHIPTCRMNFITLAAVLVTPGLFLPSHAQLVPFAGGFIPSNVPNELRHHPSRQQQPMADHHAPGIQLPPGAEDSGDKRVPTGDVILSDVIGSSKPINLFAGFTRDIDTVSRRLDTTSLNTTVLAPLNSAIQDLPRKPWEDPREYAQLGAEAYSGSDGEDRAHRNLRRFVEAHVLPQSPWKEGEKARTMNGGEIWWEKKGDKAVILPGEVEVDRIASQVANGEVWVLKKALNYS